MKKFFKLGCFGLIGLVVLIVIIAMVAGGGDDSGTSTNDSGNKAEQKKEEKVAVIGETLQVGKVEFTVNGTSTATNVGGQYGVNSQGTFLVMDVTVTNKGTEAITVDSSFFKLLAGEKTYEADSSAGIYANENNGFFLEQVNPDLSATGKVIFDVTDEVIANPDLMLNVQTGAFGTEQGKIKVAK